MQYTYTGSSSANTQVPAVHLHRSMQYKYISTSSPFTEVHIVQVHRYMHYCTHTQAHSVHVHRYMHCKYMGTCSRYCRYIGTCKQVDVLHLHGTVNEEHDAGTSNICTKLLRVQIHCTRQRNACTQVHALRVPRYLQ